MIEQNMHLGASQKEGNPSLKPNASDVKLAIELRPANTSAKLVVDLAKHLKTRCGSGQVVIVIERPVIFLASLRRQWMKLGRQVQRARASTLDAAKIAAFSAELGRMYGARFSAADTWSGADVQLVAPDNLINTPPVYITAYLCSALTPQQRTVMMEKASAEHSLVVDYSAMTTPPVVK